MYFPPDRFVARRTNRPPRIASALLAAMCAGAMVGVAAAAEVRYCPGDCNENGKVHVSETISLVRIASDLQEPDSCSAGDFNGDGQVRIDEIVRSIGNALRGCPSQRVDAIAAARMPADGPGGIILIAEGDRIVHRAAYGLANVAAGVANTVDQYFLVASMSKAFVGLAAMTLMEDGALDIEDTVASYLPELAHLGDGLRIRHLLHSNGGLPDYFDDAVFVAMSELPGDDLVCVIESFDTCPSRLSECLADATPFTRARLLDLLASWQRGLEFEPGTGWRYNNPGFDLLTLIIERIAGEPYEVFVREHVMVPAGMTDSGVGRICATISGPRGPFCSSRRARGYGWANCSDGAVGWQEYGDVLIPDLPGSATAFSTVDDLHALDRALRDGTVVRPETLEHALAGAVESGEPGFSYAFGMITGEVSGEPFLQIAGNFAGYNTTLLSFRERELTVIAALNRDDLTDGSWQMEVDHLRPILDIYLGD